MHVDTGNNFLNVGNEINDFFFSKVELILYLHSVLLLAKCFSMHDPI